MKKFFVLVFMISLNLAMVAQVSRYLENGQNGFGVRLGALKTYGSSGFSFQTGGSFKGIIDIEASFTKENYDAADNNLLNGDASSELFEGGVNWWILRKSLIPSIDINAGLGCEYAYSGYQNFKSGDPYPYQYKNYQEGLLGFEFSVNFRVSDTWWLQPNLYAFYAIGKEKWIEDSGTIRNDYQGAGNSIGLGAVRRINNHSFYLQYNQYFESYKNYENRYKFSLGYIIGF